MEIQENELIIKNEDFLLFLQTYFEEDYGIGIHGIEGNDCWIEKNGTWEINKEKVDLIKDSILNEGLNIKEGRTLMSTMSFKGLERYLSNGTYGAGGIIAALPKNMKNSFGEEIFLGKPIEESGSMDRNHKFGSLSDMILTDCKGEHDYLNSMFILGKYDKLEDEKIKINFNTKHISFNNGILPDDYFNAKKNQLMTLCELYGASSVEELLNDADNKIDKDVLSPYDEAIIKTKEQFKELNPNYRR